MQHFAVMQAIVESRNADLIAAADRHRLRRTLRAATEPPWSRLLLRVRTTADRWRVARANRRRLRELSRALAEANTTAARQELFAMAMTSDWRLFDDVSSQGDPCGAGL